MVTITVSPGFKDDGSHAAIAATHLGQAHIAGTGPAGATCEKCAFWHLWQRKKIDGKMQQFPIEAGRYSAKHKSDPAGRKSALCNKPIANKAKKQVPPNASACRFFEPKKEHGIS